MSSILSPSKYSVILNFENKPKFQQQPMKTTKSKIQKFGVKLNRKLQNTNKYSPKPLPISIFDDMNEKAGAEIIVKLQERGSQVYKSVKFSQNSARKYKKQNKRVQSQNFQTLPVAPIIRCKSPDLTNYKRKKIRTQLTQDFERRCPSKSFKAGRKITQNFEQKVPFFQRFQSQKITNFDSKIQIPESEAPADNFFDEPMINLSLQPAKVQNEYHPFLQTQVISGRKAPKNDDDQVEMETPFFKKQKKQQGPIKINITNLLTQNRLRPCTGRNNLKHFNKNINQKINSFVSNRPKSLQSSYQLNDSHNKLKNLMSLSQDLDYVINPNKSSASSNIQSALKRVEKDQKQHIYDSIDAKSNYVKLMDSVPDEASSTYQAQELNSLEMSLFESRRGSGKSRIKSLFSEKTIKEFKLTKEELANKSYKVDHVRKNINLVSKTRQRQERLQFFRSSILNKSSRSNLQLFFRQKQDTEQILRSKKINYIAKWDRFRHSRSLTIDQFIHTKRQQILIQVLLTLINLKSCLDRFIKGIDAYKEMRKIKIQAGFVCLKIKLNWKQKIKRRGGNVMKIWQNQLRYNLSLWTRVVELNQKRRKIFKILKSFLLHTVGVDACIAYFRKFIQYIIYIQTRLRNQISLRYAKVEVLENYWDKLSQQILFQASMLKDRRTINLIKHILAVPTNVRREVLTSYIDKCREIFLIVFFQWRLIHPNAMTFNEEEIAELITHRIDYTYVRQRFYGECLPFYVTLENSKIDKDFLRRYEMDEQIEKPWLINTFQQIGWKDPFPKENKFKQKFRVPENVNDLVENNQIYHRNRFIQGTSPLTIYIPRKEIMFKMMRACVSVIDKTELWYHQ